MSILPAHKSPLYNGRMCKTGEEPIRNMLPLIFPNWTIEDNGLGKGKSVEGADFVVFDRLRKAAIEVKLFNKTANHILRSGWFKGQILDRFRGLASGCKKYLVIVGKPPKNLYRVASWCRRYGIKVIHIPLEESLLKDIESLAEDDSGLFEVVFPHFVKQIVTPETVAILREGMSGLMSRAIKEVRVFPIQPKRLIISLIQRIYGRLASINGRFDDIRIYKTFLMHHYTGVAPVDTPASRVGLVSSCWVRC